MEETQRAIESLSELKSLSDEIKNYKDFLLFKKIFDNVQGSDQAESFTDAINKLNELKNKFKSNLDIEEIFKHKEFVNIFKKIKEELGRKTENKSNEFIKQMIGKFEIKEEKQIHDLTTIINNKKYENIDKSINIFQIILWIKNYRLT